MNIRYRSVKCVFDETRKKKVATTLIAGYERPRPVGSSYICICEIKRWEANGTQTSRR
jgi:hypothetical protein